MSTEIILCHTCKAAGYTKESEIENYHNNTYNEWTEVCYTCKGSGRLEKITTIEVKPYNPEGGEVKL